MRDKASCIINSDLAVSSLVHAGDKNRTLPSMRITGEFLTELSELKVKSNSFSFVYLASENTN